MTPPPPDDIIISLKLRKGKRSQIRAITSGVLCTSSDCHHGVCRGGQSRIFVFVLSAEGHCQTYLPSYHHHHHRPLVANCFLKTTLWLPQSRCCFFRRRCGTFWTNWSSILIALLSDSTPPESERASKLQPKTVNSSPQGLGEGKVGYLRAREDRHHGPSRLQVPFTGRCQSKCRGNVPPQAGEPAALIVDAQGDSSG